MNKYLALGQIELFLDSRKVPLDNIAYNEGYFWGTEYRKVITDRKRHREGGALREIFHDDRRDVRLDLVEQYLGANRIV
jgi:hypothetical protein